MVLKVTPDGGYSFTSRRDLREIDPTLWSFDETTQVASCSSPLVAFRLEFNRREFATNDVVTRDVVARPLNVAKIEPLRVADLAGDAIHSLMLLQENRWVKWLVETVDEMEAAGVIGEWPEPPQEPL